MAPYLNRDLPLPDDYELFCQDLKAVIQDPNSFVEYDATVSFHIRPATSVAAQLRTVRHHIVRFPVALALNTDAPLRPALPAPSNPCLLRPNSISRSSWPEQQLAEKSSSGPQEPLNQSGCACSLDYSAARPAASHPKDADSRLVSVSSEFINSYS